MTKTVQKHSKLNRKNARSLAAKIQNTQKRVAKGVRKLPQTGVSGASNVALKVAESKNKDKDN